MRVLLTVLVGLVVALVPAAGAGRLPGARELLRDVAHFTDVEWASVERGEPVVKILDTDTREVAVAGAVRIRGSRDQLIERSRDLELLKRSAMILDADRFSPSPTAADLQRVPFEDRSLDLRACTPGDCPVRLSSDDIARFHREVNWAAAEWRTQSARVWRDVLARYAASYQANGRKALPDYVNKREPLSVGAELAQLLGDYGFVAAYSPEFHRYMADFGPRAPAGAEHLLYWTKEDFGVRPIFRISHQVIYRPGTAPAALIATNQVYADHYLDAALGLTLALDAGSDFYMITVNRARTRSLSGILRRLVRSTVQNRCRDGLRRMLTTTKLGIEQRVR